MPNLSYITECKVDRFDLKPSQKTMMAVVTTANGGFDKLDYREVPIPELQPGEVLIQVLAAGINNTEINTRLGWYSDDGGWNGTTPFPLIQGTDCCGRVVSIADGVGDSLMDSRVLIRPCMRLDGYDTLDNIWMASDFDGAFAQFVRVPASEVFAVESQWSDAELATIPCAYGTAENMVHRAQVKESDHVLVTGASGGVGSAVVQLVKRRGARVTAVAGKSKMDALYAIGADNVIERDSDLIEAIGENSIDAVFDNVAGEGFGPLLKILKRGGRYASSGAIAGPLVTMDMRHFYLKDLNLIGCTAWDEPVFPNLISYIEKGEIKPLLAGTFDLQDIAEAQQRFLKKEHVGNFVLIPPA